jgi:tRNA threonylcarbamoyladenosine biosynthesis protein TsaB
VGEDTLCFSRVSAQSISYGHLRILALDTTTPLGSVAIVDEEAVLAEVRFRAPDRHSARLMPAVGAALDLAGLQPADVEGYAVTIGPGPFTGLRVGISTTQGLALGSGRLAVGISSLDVLAARIRGEASRLVSLIDAGRGQVYAASFDAEASRLGEASIEAAGRFGEWLPEEAAFLGDGACLHAAAILAARPSSRFPSRSLFLAATLGLMAIPRFSSGEGMSPDRLRPLYLRGADIRKAAPAV